MTDFPEQTANPGVENDQAVIRLENVHLTLGSGASRVHVLKGIDMQVPQGQSVGIVGPSGSGKSTLLMVLGGLEKADDGLVEVAGEALTTKSEDALAQFRGRNIGIVFQSFHLIPNMTALENVAVPLELAGIDGAFEKAANELKAVGLGERLDHYPGQMSGGEQQRVAIARAIAKRPEVLLCDEPTGALDSQTGITVLNALRTINRDLGTSTAIITHNAGIQAMAERVINFIDGRIASVTRNENPITPEEITW